MAFWSRFKKKSYNEPVDMRSEEYSDPLEKPSGQEIQGGISRAEMEEVQVADIKRRLEAQAKSDAEKARAEDIERAKQRVESRELEAKEAKAWAEIEKAKRDEAQAVREQSWVGKVASYSATGRRILGKDQRHNVVYVESEKQSPRRIITTSQSRMQRMVPTGMRSLTAGTGQALRQLPTMNMSRMSEQLARIRGNRPTGMKVLFSPNRRTTNLTNPTPKFNSPIFNVSRRIRRPSRKIR